MQASWRQPGRQLQQGPHRRQGSTLAQLDAQLRGQLDQLRNCALKRQWLRSLLYEPAPAAAAAAGSSKPPEAEAGGAAAAGGGKLRSLEDFADALVASQRHASEHALTPAHLRPQGALGAKPTGDALRSAVQCFLRGS